MATFRTLLAGTRLLRTVMVGLMSLSSAGLVLADEVQVAVAANFTAPFQQIAQAFTQSTGHTVRVSGASTGKLLLQIQNGAPFEVLLSADATTPTTLVAQGLAVPGSTFTYALGKLVLWSARPDVVDAEGRVLRDGAFQRLALANPKLAPYGAAAIETLLALGQLERLTPRFVQGENIAQAFQFVSTGNAELGFVALSQVAVPGQAPRGSHWVVPERLYRPIRQDAVLLKRGEGQPAAEALMRFLRSAQARQIIQTRGYGLAPAP